MKLSYYRNKCDRKWQEIGKEKNPRCLLCSNPTQVIHHFFPKSVSSFLRYDFRNGIGLCNGCHMRLHQSGDPTYEARIIEIKGEDWYDELLEVKRNYVKVNIGYYKEILNILTYNHETT